jgi:hypothetical protein
LRRFLPCGCARERAARDIDRHVACAFPTLRFAAVPCLLVAMIDSFVISSGKNA